MALLRSLWAFLQTGVWRVRLDDVSRRRSLWLRLLRIAILSFREFGRDRCSLHASALTFYTLLSIVPVAAMAFGIAKGFGLEKTLEHELRANFPLPSIVRPAAPESAPQLLDGESGADATTGTLTVSLEAVGRGDGEGATTETLTTGLELTVRGDGAGAAGTATTATLAAGRTSADDAPTMRTATGGEEDIVSWVITFSNNALENVHGGLVAGIGVILLLWVVIKVLGNIETSFNDIWGIRKPRSLGRRFSDYTFFTLVGPIVAVSAGSLTVTLTGTVSATVATLGLWDWVGGLTSLGLRLIPLSLVWLLFLMTYLFMPNTKVSWRAGIVGAIVGGTLYQLVQWVYIRFQVGVANYSVIYGSFAALPLFLVWLQMSWLIVLYGAEVSFAWQNVDTYEFDPDVRTASPAFRRLVAVAIAHVCVDAFANEDAAPTSATIAKRLGAPLRLVNEQLFALVEARVLAEVRSNGDEKLTAYHPASRTEHLTVADVMARLAHHGTADVPLRPTPTLEHLSKTLEALERRVADAPENVRLLDL